MKHLDELTGLRCIAVVMVLLAHLSPFLSPWASLLSPPGDGPLGVHIFFVLSGFLITTLLMREYDSSGRINLLQFYQRRLLRIAPAFYAFLLVIAVMIVSGYIHLPWQAWMVSATFLWNYAHLLHLDRDYFSCHDYWYLGHTWSLALEQQFYCLWPMVFCRTIGRKAQWKLPAIILAVPALNMLSYIIFPNQRFEQDVMFHTACDYILIGCFVAVHREAILMRMQRFVRSRMLFSFLVVGLLLILPHATEFFHGYWSLTYGRTIEGSVIGSLLLCILAQPNHWFSRFLRLPPLVFVGTLSYSVYLWQQLFTPGDSPLFFGFPLAFASSMAAACVSYYVVERPFLRLKSRMSAPRRIVHALTPF